MPNDYITLKALVEEINAFVQGGKIDRINMPEKDEISLVVRNMGQNRLLNISCNANNPRLHLDGDKKSNPLTAPSQTYRGDDGQIFQHTSCKAKRRHIRHIEASVLRHYDKAMLIGRREVSTSPSKQITAHAKRGNIASAGDVSRRRIGKIFDFQRVGTCPY